MADSSQGSFAGATNVKVKHSSNSKGSSSKSRLDASDLSTTGDRVYVDGLPDSTEAGATGGITSSVTYTAWGDAAPVAGASGTFAGLTGKYTDVETEYAVGELVKFSATLVSD